MNVDLNKLNEFFSAALNQSKQKIIDAEVEKAVLVFRDEFRAKLMVDALHAIKVVAEKSKAEELSFKIIVNG